MGGKTSTENPSIDFPDFHYLNRKSFELYSCCKKSITKTQILNSHHLTINSALLHINHLIYLAGGSTKTSKQSRNFYSLNLTTKVFLELSILPQATKSGFLLAIKDCLLLVGGTTFDSLSNKKRLSHIMKYSLTYNNWEVFNHSHVTLTQEKNIGLTEILQPGFFHINGKIYMIGGYYRRGNIREPNTAIVSFNLASKVLKQKIENVKFLLNIYKPLCATCNSNIIIAGGKLLDSSANLQVYVFDKKSFSIITKLSSQMVENYPIQIHQNMLIFFAFPKIFAKSERNTDWMTFEIPDQHSANQESEKTLQSSQSSRDLQSPRFKNSSESPEILHSQDTERSSCSLDDFPIILFEKVFENSENFTLPFKKAVKILEVLKEKLEKKKINPLEINQISSRLDFRKEIKFQEFEGEVSSLLSQNFYAMAEIIVFYRSVHLILSCRRVKSIIFLELLRRLSIAQSSETLPKALVVDLVSKIIKSLMIFSTYSPTKSFSS